MKILKLNKLFIIAILMILLIVLCSYIIISADNDFEASPVDYYGYIESDIPEGLSFDSQLITPYCCKLTITNKSDLSYNFEGRLKLYKLIDDEWLPVKQRNEGLYIWASPWVNADETTEFIYDWSYEYGKLSRGTYRVVILCCNINIENGDITVKPVAWEFKLTPWKLTGSRYKSYGYGGSNSEAEDITMTADRVANNVFNITVNSSNNENYIFDNTYALYINNKGRWTPVDCLDGVAYGSGDMSLASFRIIIPAMYGNIKAGDYLLVKRCLQAQGNNSSSSTDFKYASVMLHIDDLLSEDKIDSGEVSVTVNVLDNAHCFLSYTNTSDRSYKTDWDYFNLFRLEDGNWNFVFYKYGLFMKIIKLDNLLPNTTNTNVNSFGFLLWKS